LATRAPTPIGIAKVIGWVAFYPMPSFDIVSDIDRQELRNAIDQAQREMSQRFDFKGTDSSIEQNDLIITIKTISEEKARAVRVLLEEKFVKRGMSLKGIEWGKFEQASGDTVRQLVTVKVGISSDKAREINKLIKEKYDLSIESCDLKISGLNSKLERWNEAQDKIKSNLKIDEMLIKADIRIDELERMKKDKNQQISSTEYNIKTTNEKIDHNKKMIVKIQEEEEKDKIYKIYLESYGKNGVSKIIMKTRR
jgi:uncharacterized protein YajQ (UPF0234 family)